MFNFLASDEDPGRVRETYGDAGAMGLEGIVSKKLGSAYRSGRSKSWIKVKNPNAPAAQRFEDQS
jgi:ATP-dependent DNA ligase